MSDDFIREQLEAIRQQLEGIRLSVTKVPRVRTPNAKALPKSAYGWFQSNWADAEFRAMLLERLSSIDDALEDPVEVYKGLERDEKMLVHELFEDQRDDGASDA